MTPRLVDGPGGLEPELVLAEWPDGVVLTRWCGRPIRIHPNDEYRIARQSRRLAIMKGPGKKLESWLSWSEVGVATFWGSYDHMERWDWFMLSALPEGHLREKLLRGLAWKVDGETVLPGELTDDLQMYALLNEVHPVFLNEPIFREWLVGVTG